MHGYHGMTDYYDVALKQRRHQMLLENPNFTMTEGMLEDQSKFDAVADDFQPEVIIHLAAQGVILTVAHDSYREAGAAALLSYGRPKHVSYDLKSVFARNESDLRL